MRLTVPPAPAALAVGLALLLTACGPGAEAGGPSASATSACGPAPSDAPALSGDPGGLAKDGVRVTAVGTGPGDCAEYRVTNDTAEALTYFLTFSYRSPSGGALDTAERVVPSVAPGRTVRETLPVPGLAGDASGGAQVRILTVRRVPSGQATWREGPCPASGIRLYAGEGDAATGLRVVPVHLENCGTGPLTLQGFPRVSLLDEDREPVDGVRTLRGGDGIASGTGVSADARPLTLAPGERAHAGLVWRNTVDSTLTDPVRAPYARVRATPDTPPLVVLPDVDLGTTGRLGVGAWVKDETGTP